jgi:SNF2 family DNA or RNA helicase
MKHQKLVIDFIKNTDTNYAGIFCSYGTGKTLIALQLVEDNKWNRILVVSSKTAIEVTWPSEIEKHSDFRYVHLLGNEPYKLRSLKLGLKISKQAEGRYYAAVNRTVFFLVNFDGVRNIYNELYTSDFDAIFIDESTRIKSAGALRTKVLWALGKAIPNRYIMTGWPTTENVGELYSQIKFLDYGKTFGNSFHIFQKTYFSNHNYRLFLRKGSEQKIFAKIKPFCIRIENDVLALPPVVYDLKMLKPTDQQQQLLDNFKLYFQLEFGKVKIDTTSVFTLLNKALQICDGFIQNNWFIGKKADEFIECHKCHRQFGIEKIKKSECPRCGHNGYREVMETPKDEVLLDLVDEIGNQNKILIWAQYKFSVKKISKLLTKQGHDILTLTGATENAAEVVKAFQFSKHNNILVATQKKASESINLTNCKYAIYYGNSWSADLRQNSEARIRRKGSEKHSSIIYTDLVLKGTVENLVYDCLRRKKKLTAELQRVFREI